jgi:hypothetical protein
VLLVGCQDQSQPAQPQHSTDIVAYLKSQGFTPVNAPTGSAARKSTTPTVVLKTVEDAQKFVAELNRSMSTDTATVMTKNPANGRVAFRACDDAGTYYINRATYGLLSDVNLKYIRGQNGLITNVFTSVSGIPLYSLATIGEPNIYGKRGFCVDYTASFGVVIDGFTIPGLGWQRALFVRVLLDGEGGCDGVVTVGWGNCSN